MNLKELSRHLGLSQTTVSRALNGYPEVGEDTRARVLEAAKRFDYSPNATARRLATGRAGAIGIVFPVGNNLLLDPLFTDFLAGLADRAAQDHIDIVVSASYEFEEVSYRRLAQKKTVDAVVLSGPLIEDPRIPLLTSMGLPCIIHGRTRSAETVAWMDIDNEGAIRRAVELLINLSHRRIALINGDVRQTFALHRQTGWRTALEAHGLVADPDLDGTGQMTDEVGYRLTSRMLDLADPPTAFVCSSIFSASGSCRAIRDRGLVIGSDISVIAHDDGIGSIRPEAQHPPLTTTYSSIRAAGSRIAEFASDIVSGVPPQERQEIWPVDLIFRDSTRPPRRR